jgi:hypothetical protein
MRDILMFQWLLENCLEKVQNGAVIFRSEQSRDHAIQKFMTYFCGGSYDAANHKYTLPNGSTITFSVIPPDLEPPEMYYDEVSRVNPALYEIAKRVTLDAGLPYTDPRTGITTKPKPPKRDPKKISKADYENLVAFVNGTPQKNKNGVKFIGEPVPTPRKSSKKRRKK